MDWSFLSDIPRLIAFDALCRKHGVGNGHRRPQTFLEESLESLGFPPLLGEEPEEHTLREEKRKLALLEQTLLLEEQKRDLLQRLVQVRTEQAALLKSPA